MPRLRWKPSPPIALAVLCLALPPPALHVALAAAAGTLFEAAPFVLLGELVPARGLGRLIRLAGCGCGGELPGALAIPALALTWFAFGPLVALARTAGAFALVAIRSRLCRPSHAQRTAERGCGSDAFAELGALVPSAIAAGLGAQIIAAHAAALDGMPLRTAFLVCTGLLLGGVMPCATAGIAIAAALAHPLAPAAAGILATTGLVSPFRFEPRVGARGGARFARVTLGFALAALVVRGPSGLISPRLVPFDALGALLALCGALRLRRQADVRGGFAIPLTMLAALVAGSPEPSYTIDATALDAASPGERLTFTGAAHGAAGATTLVRFAITCCRIDAAPIAVRLDRALPVPAGTWIAASGTLVRSGDATLVLRPITWRRIAPPADPFLYR